MQNKIRVNLDEKSYDIKVGSGATELLPEFIGQKYSKIFILSDENVAKIHGEKLKNALNSYDFSEILIKSGENSKNFANFEAVSEEILAQNVDRKSLIIAFGGGVVGDLAGFVASTIMRGIDFIQVPTTLLSAVDSSVGGKTAINSKAGKNLIGSFYQPKLVLCDLNFLTSLPKREVLAGYAEILKYGLIEDADFFNYLTENYQNILNLEEKSLMAAILRSCEIKAKIVSEDEKEQGKRALLNFGHTFAHSLEREAGYDGKLNHGEAVGIGMIMACEMSRNLGFLSEEGCKKAMDFAIKSGLGIDLKNIKDNWSIEKLTKNLYKDKKTEDKKLNFILLQEIGKAFICKDISESEFEKVVKNYI